jgi:DNA-binding MarR family transcriptional regulator
MMKKTGSQVELNEKERRVLCGVIRYPTLSDVDIASKIGVKHSTFATIKKRLQDKQYFTRIYLPDFQGFGAEIISLYIWILSDISSKDLSILLPLKIIDMFESLEEYPNLLLTMIEGNIICSISCYSNYAQLEEELGKLDSLNLKFGLNFSSQHELHFPIRYSEFPRFFDYSRTVSKQLKIDLDEIKMNPIFSSRESPRLNITPLGYKILSAYLKGPGRTPKDISNLIGKPRTTAARWLRKFIKTGLITPRIVPNLQKLGYNLFCVCHYSIVSSQISKFHDALQIIDVELSPIMLVRSEFSIVYATIFSSFDEFQDAEAQFVAGMNKADISFNTEFQYFLSLPHTINTSNFMRNFAPIIKRFNQM